MDPIDPSPPPGCSVGFDIGGTHIKYAVISDRGDILLLATEPTANAGVDAGAWIERVVAIVSRVAAERNAKNICIASPGLAAADERSIAWMQGRMGAIQGVDWTAVINRGCKIPVLNDAHAALLGEAACGAAAGCKNVAMLTLGTGVGGSCMVDGRLQRGAIGRAGHLGHISLDPYGVQDIVRTPGSLEDAIGECTLKARSSGLFSTTAELIRAAESGDGAANEIWSRSLHHLACGMVSIINVVDPEVFIIGGGISNAGSALFEPLDRLLDQFEWRPTGSKVRIVPAALGEHAGAIGAARYVMTART